MDVEKVLKKYFATQKELLCVYLFGSTATGKGNRFSDVDVAVLFTPNLSQEQYTNKQLAIMDYLSRLLNRDVDVVVLNRANSFLKFQVIKNGTRIYERSDRLDHSFEAMTITEYFDFLPIRRRIEEAMINRIKRA